MVDHHPGFSRPAHLVLELHAAWALSPHADEDFVGVLVRPGQRPEWICGHDHARRDDAVECAAGELRRRQGGTVRVHGRPQDRWWAEPDRDYPGDTSLRWEQGGARHEMRLAPADCHAVLAALLGTAGDLGDLRDRAAALVRDSLDKVDPDIEEWALRNMQLASSAHAAGYRLCDEDWRATAESAEYVRDFLAGKLEEARRDFEPACGDDGGPDVRALKRVIAMLEEK